MSRSRCAFSKMLAVAVLSAVLCLFSCVNSNRFERTTASPNDTQGRKIDSAQAKSERSAKVNEDRRQIDSPKVSAKNETVGTGAETARAVGDSRDIKVIFNAPSGENVANSVRLYDRMVALVIGIDLYSDLPAHDQLRYAVRDAKAVASLLRQKYSFDRIVELYDEQAVKSQIMKILQGEFSNAGPNDAILIYFAGHGLTRSSAAGELGYLVPHDGSLRHDEMYKNISMQQIKFDVCPLIPAKHVLIVADACFGGLLLTRAGSLQPARTLAYLKEITGEQVRQIITAGGKDQTVLDGGPGGHSVFTGRLIQALASVEDYVTAKALGLELRRTVHAEAAARGHDQMPQVGEIYGVGDFVFVPDVSKRQTNAQDEVRQLQQELASLEKLKAKAEEQKEKANARELERQRAEKEIELENARLREKAARDVAAQKQAAEKAALENRTIAAQMESEREKQLASLKMQAEQIRKELGSPSQALGLEAAAEEIRRINSLIQKMEAEFEQSLQAQLGPLRKEYARRLAEVENIPPRDTMFETEADYQARLSKSREKADAIRAEQAAKEKAIRKNVIDVLEEKRADLVRQREELTAMNYKIGPDRVAFELVKYHPEKEYFDVYLLLNKEIRSGTCLIPKSKAKMFYQNPNLLLLTAVVTLTEKAEIERCEAKFTGPGKVAFPIVNSSLSKNLETDGFYVKLKSGVVFDCRSGLKWFAGPDMDTDWYEANKWVENLNVAGGGWRMPTRAELRSLYRKGKGNRNMTPLLQTTGWSVWSGDKKDSSGAWEYDFLYGEEPWSFLEYNGNRRGFAVRSR